MQFSRVIVGGLVPELVDALSVSIERSIDKQEEPWIVTPSTSLRLYLKTSLVQCIRDGILPGIRFFTTSGLVQFLCQHYDIHHVVAPEPVRAALLRQILADLSASGRLKRLRNIHRFRHGPLRLLKTLQELKNASLRRDDLEELLQILDEESVPAFYRERLAEFVKVWEAYEEACQQIKWADPPDRIAVLMDCITSMDCPQVLINRKLIFWGYSFLTGLVYELMRELARHLTVEVYFISRVTLKDGHQEWHPAFAYLKDLFNSSFPGYLRLPDEESGPPPLEFIKPYAKRPLARFFLDLFASSTRSEMESPEGTEVSRPRIVFHELVGKRQQVEEAVRLCAGHITRGVEPHKIAVIARSLDDYLTLFLDAFEHYRVPVNIGRDFPARLHPVGQWLLRLIDAFRNNWPVEALLDVLALPMFNITGCSLSEADRWWIPILAKQIHSAGVLYLEDLPLFWDLLRTLNEETDDLEDITDAITPIPISALNRFRQATEYLNDLIQKVYHSGSEPEAIEHWRSFLTAVTEMQALRRQRWPGPPEIALEYARAIFEAHWRDLEYLAQVHRKGAPFDPITFFTSLEELVDHLRIPSSRARYGGVWLLDAMSARGLEVDVLILTGMNDLEFPRTVDEDPFIPDDIRKSIRFFNPWVLLRREWYEEERNLFYLLLSGTGHTLHCLYQRSNERGQPVLISPFLDEIVQHIDSHPDEIDFQRVTVPRTGAFPAPEVGDPSGIPPVIHPLNWIYLEHNNAENRESMLRRLLHKPLLTGPLFEEQSLFRLTSEAARLVLNTLNRRGFSASWFLSYLRCPFQALAGRTLKLPEPEHAERSPTVSSRVLGIFLHRLLHHIVHRLSVKGMYQSAKPVDESTVRTVVDELLEEEIHHEFRVFQKLFPGLWHLIWSVLRDHLCAYLTQDLMLARQEGRRPEAFEAGIDAVFTVGKEPSQPIRLKGIIDRLDRTDEGVVLMDYKFRKQRPHWRSSFEPARFSGSDYTRDDISDRFQLSFYAWLWSLREKKASPIESRMIWIPVKTSGRDWVGMIEDYCIPEDESEAYIEAVKTVVSEVIDDLQKEGCFAVTPGNACRYCGFHIICRYRDIPVAEPFPSIDEENS